MKRMIGWLILLAIFGLMFAGFAAEKGILFAVINFAAAFIFVGLVVLAAYLIGSD